VTSQIRTRPGHELNSRSAHLIAAHWAGITRPELTPTRRLRVGATCLPRLASIPKRALQQFNKPTSPTAPPRSTYFEVLGMVSGLLKEDHSRSPPHGHLLRPDGFPDGLLGVRFGSLQVLGGGAFQHGAVDIEPGSVAGAVPGAFS
jgi:hypothetical protein